MGILYNAEDQALIEERNHAKSLTRQFNEHWEDKGRRNYLIGQIFGSLGKNVHLEAPIYLDYGYRTTIGSDFFSNFNLTVGMRESRSMYMESLNSGFTIEVLQSFPKSI